MTTTIEPTVNVQGKSFRISGSRVREAIAELPQEQASQIWWLSQHCHRHDLDRAALGRLLRKPDGNYYSHDSIYQLLGGGRIRRGEPIDAMVDAIASLRKLEDARSEQTVSGFIETRLFREIERRCLKALHRQRITYIFGDSQIGKTESLLEVRRRHNHGQTQYVEVPASGALSHFLYELAAELNIPRHLTTSRLSREIVNTFDSRMLLIIDEAHRCFNARKTSAGSAVLNFVRELWNKSKCGIAIAMTNEGRDEIINGHHSKTYQQIWRRRITPLQLPSVTPEDDLALFAAAYGLPPADDKPITIQVQVHTDRGGTRVEKLTDSSLNLQSSVNRSEGLGVWISILQDASDIAAEQKRAISWGAVIKAHAQSLAEAEIFV